MRRLIAMAIFVSGASTLGAQSVAPAGMAIRKFDELFRAATAATKDEFETTAAFASRVRAQLDTSVVAIRLDSAVVYFGYDADKKEFSSYLRMDQLAVRTSSLGKSYGVVVRGRPVNVGTHEASNAYGAKVTILDKTYDSWVVAPIRAATVSTVLSKFVIPSAPDSARSLKSAIRLYAVGRMTIGPEGEAGKIEKEFDPGTIPDPISLRTNRSLIWMNDLEVVAVDGRTGAILVRKPIP